MLKIKTAQDAAGYARTLSNKLDVTFGLIESGINGLRQVVETNEPRDHSTAQIMIDNLIEQFQNMKKMFPQSPAHDPTTGPDQFGSQMGYDDPSGIVQ